MLMNTLRALVAVAGIGPSALMPLAAYAQPMPSYATSEETIKGIIVSIDGQFGISVRDERGFIDKVVLHQGTIINPRGLSLAPGMSVTIQGRTQASSFAANEIDTPYQTTGTAPSGYDYGPYDVGNAYGYGGYPYGYGAAYPYYGSSVAIGVGGYYPAYGYYPPYGYAPGYGYYPDYGGNRHGNWGASGHDNGGHAVPVPYHTYPYHNPAPAATVPHASVPQAAMPRLAAPPPAAGYRGFGAVREQGGGYRGFGAAPARR